MPFCTNCGQEVAEGAKFCSNCGTATDKLDIRSERRRVTYAGEVRKCPSCGMELSRTAALCPSCGYEVSSEHIHPALVSFFNAIIDCDQQIAIELQEERYRQQAFADHAKRNSGWSAWSIGGKIAWVILNIYLVCIPLVIYLWRRENCEDTSYPISVQNLPTAKRKASLIENFQIPNDREAMVSTLYFIQGKVNRLSGQASNDSWYWIKVWRAKAQEIYDRATTLLPGDTVIEELYQSIRTKSFL